MPRFATSPESIRREYDRLAPDYDRRWRRYLDETLRSALDGLKLDGTARLLDLPCGTGELERLLIGRWSGPAIVGIDLSLAMLSRAASKIPAGTAVWLRADIRDLPFADASFDAAVCASGLHCFTAPERSIRELRRVLLPEGRLVLVDWCDEFLTSKLRGLWLRRVDPSYHRTYSLAECRSLLEAAGFRIEEAARFRVGPAWGMMRLIAVATP